MIIRTEQVDPLLLPTDVLVAGIFEGQKLRRLAQSIDKALNGQLKSVMIDQDFKGVSGESIVLHTHGKIGAKRVLLIGLGKEKNFDANALRKTAALVARRATSERVKRIAFYLGDDRGSGATVLRASASVVAEGLLLSMYHFGSYFGDEAQQERKRNEIDEVVIAVAKKSEQLAVDEGIAFGRLQAEAVIVARDLGNTPAADMTPKHLVDIALSIAAKSKTVSVEIFDREEATRRGMGAFVGVAKGSEEAPYFIHLTYKPRNKRSPDVKSGSRPKRRKKTKIFIVGKGITFDSGGLHIKPRGSIETMKLDMAGGAAVLAVFSKIDELQPHVEVHGVIPATENMPSGKAMKPGDVVRALNGKTIEVIDTDAEGRLVLADALSFAVQQKADAIVDLATLTGSCMVALGTDVAGLFGNNVKLKKDICAVADEVDEPLWELPLVESYRQNMKGRLADLRNIGTGRYGDAINAALFLREFVGQTPWVHVDIAGPSDTEKETNPYTSLGATGFGVRTLIAWLKKVR